MHFDSVLYHSMKCQVPPCGSNCCVYERVSTAWAAGVAPMNARIASPPPAIAARRRITPPFSGWPRPDSEVQNLPQFFPSDRRALCSSLGSVRNSVITSRRRVAFRPKHFAAGHAGGAVLAQILGLPTWPVQVLCAHTRPVSAVLRACRSRHRPPRLPSRPPGSGQPVLQFPQRQGYGRVGERRPLPEKSHRNPLGSSQLCADRPKPTTPRFPGHTGVRRAVRNDVEGRAGTTGIRGGSRLPAAGRFP